MIEVTPIDPAGVWRCCPFCKAELIRFLPNQVELPHGGYLFDGDTIPIMSDLPPAACAGGCTAELAAGECPVCDKPLIEISLKFTDAEPDDETENTFFYCNGDRGTEHHFRLSDGKETWIATRLDTPIGPMAEHSFGPFLDTFGNWIGPNGVSMCRGGGPWDFAAVFALEHWLPLRALPKGMGLDPANPLAQSRPIQTERFKLPYRPPPAAPIEDDDIPF